MKSIWHKDRCCNPFQEKGHLRKKSLRYPSESCLKKMPSLTKTQLLCHSCRNRIEGMSTKLASAFEFDKCVTTSAESLGSSFYLGKQISNISVDTRLPVVNDAMALLDQSPIPRKKLNLSSNQWKLKKIDAVANALRQDLGVASTSTAQQSTENYKEMFTQVKELFDAPNTTYDLKIQLLTLLPKSWSIDKIVRELGTTRHMARSAKRLCARGGILSKPDKKRGKPLSPALIAEVIKFYEDDEMSSLMPGRKDFVSVKDPNGDGRRIHRQKRLILCNLKELYILFTKRNPGLAIGFSKFTTLRPDHCVLAGGSGTHTVCVCSMHENMKLMIEASHLPSLTKDHDHPLQNFEDVLMLLTCDDERPECSLNNCNQCPGTENLKEIVFQILSTAGMENISYKQWVSKPRTSLEPITSTMPEFVQKLCDQAKILLTHSFIAKQQSKFMRLAKQNLKDGECVVICDFSENYAFVVQNAAPGFHWNNSQATIYPVVTYFKTNGVLEHRSLVIISDCLKHDAVAVYTFSKIVNRFIRTFIANPTKIMYFSDGAPQQFKNFKNFSNVYHHENDFGVPAEWHFFATAHGKGPCDGLGGTVKRLAARASLQLPAQQQITTPWSLYEWTKENVSGITIEFSSVEDYEEAKKAITEARFVTVKATPQTQKSHCLIPIENGNVLLRRYSLADDQVIHRLIK